MCVLCVMRVCVSKCVNNSVNVWSIDSLSRSFALSGLSNHCRTISDCSRYFAQFRTVSHNFPEFRFVLQLLSGLSSHGCFASGSSGSYFHDLNPGKSRGRAEMINNQTKLDQFWEAAFIEITGFHVRLCISCFNYTICFYYSTTEETKRLGDVRTLIMFRPRSFAFLS